MLFHTIIYNMLAPNHMTQSKVAPIMHDGLIYAVSAFSKTMPLPKCNAKALRQPPQHSQGHMLSASTATVY